MLCNGFCKSGKCGLHGEFFGISPNTGDHWVAEAFCSFSSDSVPEGFRQLCSWVFVLLKGSKRSIGTQLRSGEAKMPGGLAGSAVGCWFLECSGFLAQPGGLDWELLEEEVHCGLVVQKPLAPHTGQLLPEKSPRKAADALAGLEHDKIGAFFLEGSQNIQKCLHR